MELSEYEQQSINELGQAILDGKWSNDGLVSLMKVIADDFLQAKRVSNFACKNGISPQGARKFRNGFKIDGYQFIVDNE